MKKLGNGISAREETQIRDVGKAADIKKCKTRYGKLSKARRYLNAGNSSKKPGYTDVMKRFRCDKDDSNDDFIPMERENESGNGEAPSYVGALEVQKGCNCMQLLALKKSRYSAAKRIRDP